MFEYRYRTLDGRWLVLRRSSGMPMGILEERAGSWAWWWYDTDGLWIARPPDIEGGTLEYVMGRADRERIKSFGPGRL